VAVSLAAAGVLAALVIEGGSQPAPQRPSPLALPHRDQGGSPIAGLIGRAPATSQPWASLLDIERARLVGVDRFQRDDQRAQDHQPAYQHRRQYHRHQRHRSREQLDDSAVTARAPCDEDAGEVRPLRQQTGSNRPSEGPEHARKNCDEPIGLLGRLHRPPFAGFPSGSWTTAP
jgi:hypothetical protein